jgi:tetratricopeptide (TPR) repeat protein
VVVLTNSHPVPAEAIAVALLDTVLGHTPEPARPLVLHEIYPTLMHEGRQAAIEKYEALRVDRPDDYDFNAAQFYQVGWANLLTALKMPKEAIEVIELAVAIHADSDAYHHLLALAYDEFDDRAQAIRCLERCLALNPDHQGATEMLVRMR